MYAAGFSCHMFARNVNSCVAAANGEDACVTHTGANAAVKAGFTLRAGWHEIKPWSIKGSQTLYNNANQFSSSTGRFVAKMSGYYLCTTQIRMDYATKFVHAIALLYFVALIGVNMSINLFCWGRALTDIS